MGSEKHQSVGPVQCIQRIASYSALYHTGSAIIIFDCFTFDVFECFETGCCTAQSTYFNEGALLPQADMPYGMAHTKALPWLDYKKMVFNSYNIDMKAHTVNSVDDQIEIINRVCK